ncbi:hypothetical protein HMPREF3226_02665 [Prevotella corporis]|uniref:Uncharacterized protein n=1 Tax=Prevotella corporis TaxID=28128 RepID=A0A133PTM7_9BACT|nr:hypothetical protein HMPREF3226_02665 [Prevotella corporis]
MHSLICPFNYVCIYNKLLCKDTIFRIQYGIILIKITKFVK